MFIWIRVRGCTSVFIQKHSNGLFGHFNLVVSYENVITHRPHCIFGRLLFLLPSFHCLYTKPKLSLGLMKFLLSWLSAPFKDEDYLELDMKFEDSHTCNYWSLLTLFTPTTNVLPVFSRLWPGVSGSNSFPEAVLQPTKFGYSSDQYYFADPIQRDSQQNEYTFMNVRIIRFEIDWRWLESISWNKSAFSIAQSHRMADE